MGKASRKRRAQLSQEVEWLPSGVRLIRLTEHPHQNHLRIPAGQLLYEVGVAQHADTCLATPEAISDQRRTLAHLTDDEDPRVIQYVAVDRRNQPVGVIHARAMANLAADVERRGADPATVLSTLNITQMAVSPEQQRSGIGSDLVRAVEQDARNDSRYRTLTLFAEGDLASLRSFYTALGFTCGADGERHWPSHVVPAAISRGMPPIHRRGFFCWKDVQ